MPADSSIVAWLWRRSWKRIIGTLALLISGWSTAWRKLLGRGDFQSNTAKHRSKSYDCAPSFGRSSIAWTASSRPGDVHLGRPPQRIREANGGSPRCSSGSPPVDWGHQPQGETDEEVDAGFLEGAAGIGVALLAAILQVEPTWDRALLLS